MTRRVQRKSNQVVPFREVFVSEIWMCVICEVMAADNSVYLPCLLFLVSSEGYS
jgi:hypothetical protein